VSPAMTVRELARYLNVDEKTVYRLVQRGELPGFKVAGTWRFQRLDVDRWIESRKAASNKGSRGTRSTKGRSGATAARRST
jgi:excisionase family DNA binding protein